MKINDILVNEHTPELAAGANFNPTIQHDSAARVQMMSSHLSQALPVRDATPRRLLTGVEREFGRFTFDVRIPVNAEILEVIQKYPVTLGIGGIRSNPTTMVVFMDNDRKIADVLEFDSYHSAHPHFGFNWKYTKEINRLVPGAKMEKDTILAHSPTIDNQGNYRIGLETQVLYASLEGIIEDGIIVSESYCKRLTTRCIESRAVSFGKNMFPLNLYGDENNYKPFPDIGDKIRDDGLVFALRRMASVKTDRIDDEIMYAPLEMSVHALTEVDYAFDELCYGRPGAVVSNIVVRHDARSGPGPTPIGMEVQPNKYYQAECMYHQSILNAHKKLYNRYGDRLVITPQFQRVLREAQMYLPCPDRARSVQMYQLHPLDDWRVDLTYEYDFEPTIGSKLTGLHGNKGVICQKWRDEDMPVDRWGRRAEMIEAPTSMMDRMNPGRGIEHYVNGCAQELEDQIKGIRGEPITDEEMWPKLLRFYQIVVPEMYDLLTSADYKGTPQYHLDSIRKGMIHLWHPLNAERMWPDIMEDLRREFPPMVGPVRFRGPSGKYVESVEDMMIASTYIVLLEKTGVECSAVSSARHQHFGLPAKQSKQDRYSYPIRANPVRFTGESEGRLIASTSGGEMVAQLQEMSNSPAAHANVCQNILEAEMPSNIDRVLDRDVVPTDTNRSRLFVTHNLQCAGIEFIYVDGLDEGEIYPGDPQGMLRDLDLVEEESEGDEDETEAETEETETEAEETSDGSDD